MNQSLKNQTEIRELKQELAQLKEVVETFSTLLNRKLLKELEKDAQEIEEGKYYTEEEFIKRHNLENL